MPTAKSSDALTRILFVRHTSVAVPPGVCYGSSDVPLASTFPAEAARVAEKLVEKLDGKSVSAVYTSPLSRAVLLARACGYPDAIPDARLVEMNFGEWEMKRWDNIADPRLQQWYADYFNVVPTGGESFMQQRARVESFLRDVSRRHPGGLVAAFCHGGVIMQAMLIAALATPQSVFSLQPPYGGIIEITLPTHA